MPSSGLGMGIGQGLIALGGSLGKSVTERKQERIEWARNSLEQQRLWDEKDFRAAQIGIQKSELALKESIANRESDDRIVAFGADYITKMKMAQMEYVRTINAQQMQGNQSKELQAQRDEAEMNLHKLDQASADLRSYADNQSADRRQLMGVLGQKQEVSNPGTKLEQRSGPPSGENLRGQVERAMGTMKTVTDSTGMSKDVSVKTEPDDKDFVALWGAVKAGTMTDEQAIAKVQQHYPKYKYAESWWIVNKSKVAGTSKTPSPSPQGKMLPVPTMESPDSVWAQAKRMMAPQLKSRQ